MILADKIIALRKKNGWSQEELAERLDVSRQSVSKWEGGLSVPDMNKIIGMSALFGVSTDYLLKDELEEITPSETQSTDDKTDTRTLSAEQANRYLEVVRHASLRIAFGVMLCILSPVLLIFLCGLSEHPSGMITEQAAVAVGICALFALVGAAVALFIIYGLQLSAFSYLDRESFTLDYGVQGILEKKQAEYRPHFIKVLTISVVLILLAVLPLIIGGVLALSDTLLIGFTALLIAVCAVCIMAIVRISYCYGAYERLLQTGEFSKTEKGKKKGNEAVETAYWAAVTALYLLISFLTMAWHITWIIWPVAACLCPIVELVANAVRKK